MIIGWIGQLAVLEKGFVKSRSLLGHFHRLRFASSSQKTHKGGMSSTLSATCNVAAAMTVECHAI